MAGSIHRRLRWIVGIGALVGLLGYGVYWFDQSWPWHHFRTVEKSDEIAAVDSFYERAYGLLSSQEAREAFDMTKEDLIPECDGIVGGAHLIEEIMEGDCKVLTY